MPTYGYGHVFAHMTATTHKPDDSEWYECGWIDPGWSRTQVHESRNDVDPVVSVDLDFDGQLSEDATEEIFDAAHNNLGAFEDNGDGTYYVGQDSDQDYITGQYWSYALHFTIKFYGPDGWTEKPYRPAVLTHAGYPHDPGRLPGCYACDYITERLAP